MGQLTGLESGCVTPYNIQSWLSRFTQQISFGGKKSLYRTRVYLTAYYSFVSLYILLDLLGVQNGAL